LRGDFQKRLRALDRQAALIELSTEHADFFTQNLVAIRCLFRWRSTRAWAFVTCTFTASTAASHPHARGREREEVVVSGNAV
jgi:hypothetical protein